MKSIADLPIREFAEALGSREPAPGAGAAAAAALTMGIGCAQKAIGITLKHRPEHGALVAIDARLADLRVEALRLIDEDGLGFRALLAGEHGAAEQLVALGARALHLAGEALGQAARAAALVQPTMRNDIVAAERLIEAAAAIFSANLQENAEAAT